MCVLFAHRRLHVALPLTRSGLVCIILFQYNTYPLLEEEVDTKEYRISLGIFNRFLYDH
jgi:hypothetical protein